MKTFLVPTDFSRSAYVAAHFAIELAHATKAKIILLNVFQIPIPPPDSLVTPISYSDLQEESLKRLKTMADIEFRINKNYPDLDIEYKADMGNTVEEIIETSANIKADMIIMGTYGSSGLFKNIVGSNTASVIKKASCPVFAIPADAKFQGFKKITFAVDFSEIYANHTLEQFTQFATIFQSEVDLLHVIKKPKEKTEMEKERERIKILDLLKSMPVSFHIVLNENVSEAIEYFMEETHSDALVVMPHKHNFWGFLFNESITRQLVFKINKPLLCLASSPD